MDSPPTSSYGDGLLDQFLEEGDQVSDQRINYILPADARQDLVLGVWIDSLRTSIDFTQYVVGVRD